MNATLTGKPAQTDVSDMPAEAVPVPEEDSRAPETIAEPSPVNNDGEVTSEHVKGKLLSALRKPGSEMLWNVMQNVDITYGRGVICLRPKKLCGSRRYRSGSEQAQDRGIACGISAV